MMTLVLGVIFFSTSDGERLYVLGSISTKIGVAPQRTAQFAEATKVMGVVMISSPGWRSIARQAIWSAEVPELTAIEYLALQ